MLRKISLIQPHPMKGLLVNHSKWHLKEIVHGVGQSSLHSASPLPGKALERFHISYYTSNLTICRSLFWLHYLKIIIIIILCIISLKKLPILLTCITKMGFFYCWSTSWKIQFFRTNADKSLALGWHIKILFTRGKG